MPGRLGAATPAKSIKLESVHLEKQFDVARERSAAVEIVARDDTLEKLFEGTRTEVTTSDEGRKTTRTHYTALGRVGTATFHFSFEPDGDVTFEKVCDGNVWRALSGSLRFVERLNGTRVHIEMNGRTKPLVPEFTIKGLMRDQIEQMARALRDRLEDE